MKMSPPAPKVASCVASFARSVRTPRPRISCCSVEHRGRTSTDRTRANRSELCFLLSRTSCWRPAVLLLRQGGNRDASTSASLHRCFSTSSARRESQDHSAAQINASEVPLSWPFGRGESSVGAVGAPSVAKETFTEVAPASSSLTPTATATSTSSAGGAPVQIPSPEDRSSATAEKSLALAAVCASPSRATLDAAPQQHHKKPGFFRRMLTKYGLPFLIWYEFLWTVSGLATYYVLYAGYLPWDDTVRAITTAFEYCGLEDYLPSEENVSPTGGQIALAFFLNECWEPIRLPLTLFTLPLVQPGLVRLLARLQPYTSRLPLQRWSTYWKAKLGRATRGSSGARVEEAASAAASAGARAV